jgi:DNA-binding response OmpR family regulator
MDQQDDATVLLVESDDSLRRVISASLEQINVKVIEASGAESAQAILENEHPELLIVELDFPHEHNSKLIEVFRENKPNHKGAVVVITAQRPSNTWRRKYQPRATVYKPFDIRHLCRVITTLVRVNDRKSAEVSTNSGSNT